MIVRTCFFARLMMRMIRTYGIFIIGELLLLSWQASGAGISSFRIYDLPWQQQQVHQPPPHEDDGYNALRQQVQYDLQKVKSNARDVSYLPEDVYDEEQKLEQEAADGEERLSRNDRSLLPEYRNLCETVTRKVNLKNDPNYEYQPPHYHEVFCKSYSLMDDEPVKPSAPSKQKCAHPSFHCVQRSRTLFLVRRRWDGECWEPVTKVVASGCDCMWPVSSLGDVSIHY
ncbi:uncharacterized protein LOC100679753 isoform X1 [Nasonia vitripennis]|uniref:Uncharacterized protein n=1 Tax=Nasonia vitripennis TaxID=7425 RepID=A0A7M7Q2R8_NASVI|nr:uncharacterized protein LOC100679753 isoform X1 [Nasonia vitripennis]